MTKKYTKEHEWLQDNGDGSYTIGITEHAQSQLGDVVYVELPEIGAAFEATDEAATVESVKAASEVYAPISGEITAINEALNDNPVLVNEAAETDGWFFKIKPSDAAQLDALMTEDEYKELIG